MPEKYNFTNVLDVTTSNISWELHLKSVNLFMTDKQKDDIFSSFITDEISDFNSNVYYTNPDYLRCSYLEGKMLAAVKPGSAVITAKVGNYQATCAVTVDAPLKEIVPEKSAINMCKVKNCCWMCISAASVQEDKISKSLPNREAFIGENIMRYTIKAFIKVYLWNI